MNQIHERCEHLVDLFNADDYTVSEESNSVTLHFGDAGDVECDESTVWSLTAQEFGGMEDDE